MVAFLTLLLGLTLGIQRIELAVDHRVTSVELRLDGEQVALLRGEPWAADCDFGRALLPHHLEAIARDGDGNVLDRAVQRVNLPRDAAEATMRLVGEGDRYVAAELAWRAADESEPQDIQVRFDGEPLAVQGRRVALPSYDAKTVHVLAAELLFPNQVRARVELAFGGEYGEKVSTELTAVALELDGAKELPTAEMLQSWLRTGDQPAHVVAVERGPLELVMVRDDSSLVTLRSLGRQAASSSGPRRSQSAPQRMSAGLAVKDTLLLVGTHPILVPVKGGGWNALFPVSDNVNSPSSGLGWTLTNLFFRSQESTPERLAEAVGVAGLRAMASNRVRALLLVRSTDAPGSSAAGGLEPANVRAFLAALRVPFFYWTVGASRDHVEDPWGDSTLIHGWGAVHVAVSDLMEALRPQFLVWIEGLHKPGDVVLAPEAPAGLRLAGAARPAAALSGAGSRPSRPASPVVAD